jgi:hypothetical protein
MNQAVFERFLVGDDGTTDAEPTGAFGILLAPDLFIRQSTKNPMDRTDSTKPSTAETHPGGPQRRTLMRQLSNPDSTLRGLTDLDIS